LWNLPIYTQKECPITLPDWGIEGGIHGRRPHYAARVCAAWTAPAFAGSEGFKKERTEGSACVPTLMKYPSLPRSFCLLLPLRISRLMGLWVILFVSILGGARGQTESDRASEVGLLHSGPLPVVAAPKLEEPLGADWKIQHGRWTPANGELKAVELPEDKHSAVLHHRVGLASAIIELEFRLDSSGFFGVGCDGPPHVGRVIIVPKRFHIAQDSKEMPKILAAHEMSVAVGEWHKLRVEWKGDQMAARLDGQELRARHDYFLSRKGLTWIGLGPGSATIRNLRISGEASPAK
jgi:hypothetical protein